MTVSRAAVALCLLSTLAAHDVASADASADRAASAVPDVPSSADPGACFARVTVPAVHEVEPIEIERRAAHTRFEVRAARFEPGERRVVVREAASTLRAMQPTMETETRRRELAPATTRWVRDALDGELPLGPGDRLALVAAGVDVESIAPGTCLAERYRPATLGTTPERVLLSEASEQLFVTDAVFESAMHPLVTRPAHERLVEVPTVWEAGTQRVVTELARTDADGEASETVSAETRSRVTVGRPATLTRVPEPPVVEQLEVQRLATDAFGTREPQPAVWGTLDIPHVEEPAGFVWEVVSADAVPGPETAEGEPAVAAARPDDASALTGRRFCHREWPAEAIEYEHAFVTEEGRFERETQPPEHAVHDVQALLENARGVPVDVPAVVETLERRVRTRESRVEWRPVLCGTQVNAPLVSRLQRALAREGFSPGAIDGQLGPGTLRAVDAYQRERELATGGLTVEALEALGMPLR